MKKILLIHTKYQDLGGEDIAVENEASLLKENFKVREVYFQNELTNPFTQFFKILSNRSKKSMKLVEAEINNFKPDMIYIHNTWFEASLGIFKVANKYTIPTYIKLHNFRYFCTNYILIKNHIKHNNVCGACGGVKQKYSLINKYFDNSLIKSILVLNYGKKYYKILKNSKFKIFVLTDFHKKFLISLGFDSNKIEILYNAPPKKILLNDQSKDNYIIYAGRISREKGVEDLIEAFLESNLDNFCLKIVGVGPEYSKLRTKYSSEKVKFYGLLSNSDTKKLIQNSNAVVTATKLFEGQPTILTEASVFSVPSIFPDFGGMSEFFPASYKLKFKQHDNKDLINKLNLLKNKDEMKELGKSNYKFLDTLVDEKLIIEKFNTIMSTTNGR